MCDRDAAIADDSVTDVVLLGLDVSGWMGRRWKRLLQLGPKPDKYANDHSSARWRVQHGACDNLPMMSEKSGFF